MTVYIRGIKYIPSTYAKTTQSASQLAEKYIREWDEKRFTLIKEEAKKEIAPSICFSRDIGVGAHEIATILAEKIGYRVVDREIVEYIADEAKLSEKTVALFDERYPGTLREFFALALGERAFIKNDYTRHLFSLVFSIAGLGPTIFVGRGAHLLLPRDRILAVRIICSRSYRIERLKRVLNIEEKEAESALEEIDKEQRDFYRKVYGKKDASSPYDFDIVINYDYVREPRWASEIIEYIFKKRFGAEIAET